MSYFRPQNVRKIATRSVSGLPNSTQNVSRKRGRVKSRRLCPKFCDTLGGHLTSSELIENGVAPSVVQRQMRHSDARITIAEIRARDW